MFRFSPGCCCMAAGSGSGDCSRNDACFGTNTPWAWVFDFSGSWSRYLNRRNALWFGGQGGQGELCGTLIFDNHLSVSRRSEGRWLWTCVDGRNQLELHAFCAPCPGTADGLARLRYLGPPANPAAPAPTALVFDYDSLSAWGHTLIAAPPPRITVRAMVLSPRCGTGIGRTQFCWPWSKRCSDLPPTLVIDLGSLSCGPADFSGIWTLALQGGGGEAVEQICPYGWSRGRGPTSVGVFADVGMVWCLLQDSRGGTARYFMHQEDWNCAADRWELRLYDRVWVQSCLDCAFPETITVERR